VQGDTNTVLAGLLAGRKTLASRVGHVEAGTGGAYDSLDARGRSTGSVADHVERFSFCGRRRSAAHNLRKEGRPDSGIFVTGKYCRRCRFFKTFLSPQRMNRSFPGLGIEKGEYILVSAHRQENVDRQEEASPSILKGIELVGNEFGVTVLYPIHPRSKEDD